MRYLLIAVTLVLGLAACDSREVRTDRSNCERLKEGMSYPEVLAVMGASHTEMATDYPSPGRNIMYGTPAFASGPISVHFLGSDQNLRVDYLQCNGQD
jgi:hypothetical protein